VACAGVLALAAPAQAGAPIHLPALTKLASELSGLKSKRAPRVVFSSGGSIEKRAQILLDRDYPRDQQAYDETLYRALGLLQPNERLRPLLLLQLKGVRGLYDPMSRTVWARRAPTPQLKRTVVHELVHSLQDQTFDLKRVSSLRRGSRDAASASLAATQGSASFFVDVLGGGRIMATRTPQSSQLNFTGSRGKLFVELISAFPYTTGLRFAAGLQNVGGRPAIYSALRRLPETTEQIFHLDAFLAHERALPLELPTSPAGYELAREDTFGELDVRALLAVFAVPRLDKVGTGWGAGASALYRGADGSQAMTIRLDWDADIDAREWSEAVVTYVNEAFDADNPGPAATTPCAAEVCWTLPGQTVAFRRTGSRTALVFGRDAAKAAALANALVGG
jgi:hypothetical protein